MNKILYEKININEFEDFIGNENIINILKSFINNKYLPNLLISGPNGCGKSTAINILINKYFDDNPKNFCLKIFGSIYRGKNNISDTLINKQNDFTSEPNIVTYIKTQHFVKPGKHKIILIYDFDCMTNDAQMALRRVIELYEQNVRFIFICNDKTKIIEALHSRCTSLEFRSLHKDDIRNILKNYEKNEIKPGDNVNISEKIFDIISVISSGDIKYALNMYNFFLNSDVIGISETIQEENLYKIFNLQPMLDIKKIYEYCINKKLKQALYTVDKLLDSGYNIHDILYYLYKILYLEKDISTEYLESLVSNTIIIENSQSNTMLYNIICDWILISTK